MVRYTSRRLIDIMLRPAGPDEINQRYSMIEVMGIGVAAGVGTFLSVFMARLGASTLLISLITALPALSTMLLSIPSGEFLAGRRDIVPWYAWTRLVALLPFGLVGLVPFLSKEHAPEIIVLICALCAIPQGILSIAFNMVMSAIAGPGGRMTLMSRRWALLGVIYTLIIAAVGQALRLFTFPLNYQVVFLTTFVGSAVAVVYALKLRMPAVEHKPVHRSALATLREQVRTLRRSRPFVSLLIGQLVLRIGLNLATPLFPIYWVRSANASDASISAITATQTIVTTLAYFFWARASQKRGPRSALLMATLGICLYPLLTALTVRVELLVIWAALGGLFAAGIELVIFDILMRSCPQEDQAAFMGLNQMTVSLATFAGPLAATVLADSLGIVPALIAASVLEFAGFGLLALLSVGKCDEEVGAA